METFRVALFTGNYNHIRDGVSLTLNRLVGFLEDAGVEVLIFSPTVDNPALHHRGRLVSVPSLSMPGRPEYRITVAFTKEVKIELEHFNPDIVHIATPDLLGFKALQWAKRKNIVIVASYHTHFPGYLKYYKLHFLESLGWRYLRWFYSFCTHVYVPTPSMIQTLNENGIYGDLRIWERGVDTDLFSPAKRDEAWRLKQGFDEDDIVVTFVSRLVWEKNLEIFSDAIRAMTGKSLKVKALVVGEGPAMPRLRKLLPGAVYTGFLSGDELAIAYASSDIFFFPSDTETFGNVTLEAMASGLPCVVADAVGSKSLVDHGENGYLISIPGLEEFILVLTELAENRELRIKMGESSREKSKKYTWDQINQKLLSYYKEAQKVNSKHR